MQRQKNLNKSLEKEIREIIMKKTSGIKLISLSFFVLSVSNKPLALNNY